MANYLGHEALGNMRIHKQQTTHYTFLACGGSNQELHSPAVT
jgi:hypothetical protein